MRKMTKNGIFYISKLLWTGGVLCVVFLCVAVYTLTLSTYRAGAQSYYDFVVVIDAGHGGIDGGVVGGVTGVKESDLNLEMAYLLKDKFENCGFKAVLTRKDKNGLYGDSTDGFKQRDMRRRKEIITEAKADMVISLHMNKFSSSARSGPQVFYDGSSEGGEALAKSVQTMLNDFTGNTHSALEGDYYMLKCTSAPSVIVECGFLSNPEDEKKLTDADYRDSLCEVILRGALYYMSGAGI